MFWQIIISCTSINAFTPIQLIQQFDVNLRNVLLNKNLNIWIIEYLFILLKEMKSSQMSECNWMWNLVSVGMFWGCIPYDYYDYINNIKSYYLLQDGSNNWYWHNWYWYNWICLVFLNACTFYVYWNKSQL